MVEKRRLVMLWSKKQPINTIEIWFPKYSTQYTDKKERVVLVAQYKVETHNKIVFTKAKHLAGREFYVSGEVVRKCPVVTNGTIPCYEIPMSALELLEYKEDIIKIANELFPN